MSTPVADTAEARALIARLGRGIEHRINNLVTVLVISAQQVEDMEGGAQEREEVRAAMDQTVDKLGLLQLVLASRSQRTDASRLAAALATVVSGLDHRITVDVQVGDELEVDVATHALARTLIAASMVVHSALSDGGGRITIAVANRDDGARIELIATPSEGATVSPLHSLDRQAKEDLRLFASLAADAGMEADVGGGTDELCFALSIPAR